MYSWKELKNEDIQEDLARKSHGSYYQVQQYEILDPDQDQIAIVTSESEAETLISHLNR